MANGFREGVPFGISEDRQFPERQVRVGRQRDRGILQEDKAQPLQQADELPASEIRRTDLTSRVRLGGDVHQRLDLSKKPLWRQRGTATCLRK
jgi:hypothetical protein